MNSSQSNLLKDKRVLIAIIVAVVLLGMLLAAGSTHKSNTSKGLQTGGNYSPDATTVVFHDSNSLYAQLRNEEIDALRSQIASYAEQKYGKGRYSVQVVGDKLNYVPGPTDMPPSFSFTVTFDGHSGALKIDVDKSSGTAVFTLET
jgi:ABC-type oligopeptide transport system substrate-binding subunit